MNFADPDVLELSKIYKKVTREEERMRQFVRFQKTADGIFFAVMNPLYNVLPLSACFFSKPVCRPTLGNLRYGKKIWIILRFANRRNRSILRFANRCGSGQINHGKLDDYELAFHDLWKGYLKAITIRERKNLKLQRQFMPKRFWKYLVEKKLTPAAFTCHSCCHLLSFPRRRKSHAKMCGSS